jgi:hypothetical protein
VTVTEFLALCKSHASHGPINTHVMPSAGMPAHLWYQMLAHGGLAVLPRAACEDDESFPLPDDVYTGARREPGQTPDGTCLDAHARGYFYTRVAAATKSMLELQAPCYVHDARRFHPDALRAVRIADEFAARLRRGSALGALPAPVADLALAYWIGGI